MRRILHRLLLQSDDLRVIDDWQTYQHQLFMQMKHLKYPATNNRKIKYTSNTRGNMIKSLQGLWKKKKKKKKIVQPIDLIKQLFVAGLPFANFFPFFFFFLFLFVFVFVCLLYFLVLFLIFSLIKEKKYRKSQLIIKKNKQSKQQKSIYV